MPRSDLLERPRDGQAAAALPGVTVAAAADHDAARINCSVAKRALDIVGSALALLVLSPLFLAIAIAIRIDSPGPVFYRQPRNGRGGPFSIYKFRSMRSEPADAEFRQASRDDARVTRIGRVLRRRNLDELPQLLNVLRGEMSLVGPRPHPLALDQHFAPEIPNLMARYAVRPGMTGWAQVNGFRGETRESGQMAGRIEYDLAYLSDWSIRRDLTIILMTVSNPKAFENAF